MTLAHLFGGVVAGKLIANVLISWGLARRISYVGSHRFTHEYRGRHSRSIKCVQ